MVKQMRFSKIFGIGLPRTGTTSLNIALNRLGIPSIHFPFSLYEFSDFKILDQYVGFVDTPIPALYQQLDQLCPNAGFILTTRPVEQWLASMEWLLREGPYIWGRKVTYDDYLIDFWGSKNFDSSLYIARYQSFHAEVMNYFEGRDDLLVLDLDIGYGYQELCYFLDLPIPYWEYPRNNEKRPASLLQKLAYNVGKYNSTGEHWIRRLDYYSKRLQKLLKWL